MDDDQAVVGEADAGGEGAIRRGWAGGSRSAVEQEGVATSIIREGAVVIGGAAIHAAYEVVVVAALGKVLEDGNEAVAVDAAAAVRLVGRGVRRAVDEGAAIEVSFHLVVVNERCI